MRKLLLTGIAPCLLLASGAAIADVCRVTANAAPGGAGSSWETDPITLNDALATEQCGELWLQTGVYVPGVALEDSFIIPAGVAVLGGFAGTETDAAARNPAANPTVLSGDIDGDDVVDGDGVTVSWSDQRGDNSLHVVTVEAIPPDQDDGAQLLDGLIITGGDASFTADEGIEDAHWGGGLLCSAPTSDVTCAPRLHDIRFRGNRALNGAGLMLNMAMADEALHPMLEGVRFEFNRVSSQGGGLYILVNSGTGTCMDVSNTSFVGNESEYFAGALSSANYAHCDLVLDGVEFTSNISHYPGLGIMEFHGDYAGLRLSGSSFTSNDGTAIIVDFPHSTMGTRTKVEIDRVSFDANSRVSDVYAYMPSSFSMSMSNVSMTNSTGGIQNDMYLIFPPSEWGMQGVAAFRADNVTFAHNESGPAFVFKHSGSMGTLWMTQHVLRNLTLANNKIRTADHLMLYHSAINGSVSSLEVGDTIFWNNTVLDDPGEAVSAIETKEAAETFLDRSIVAGGADAVVSPSGPSPFDAGTGNMELDPLLGPLAIAGNGTRYLMPSSESPAVDAGSCVDALPRDQRGMLRPIGGECDIGAIEVDTRPDLIFASGFESDETGLTQKPISTRASARQPPPLRWSPTGLQ